MFVHVSLHVRREREKNQLDVTERFIALIICSTCFEHFYAHHQELETICVLLPPMVCGVLVAGCWRSGAGQPVMRSGCPAPDLQQPTTKAPHIIGGNNTHIYSLELLMMGIEMPETC